MGIRATVERFVEAFNCNDLDAVMEFFAESAIYQPGDGSSYRGRTAIRAAFLPQFRGDFGTMRFDVDDALIDEAARKVAIRWICRHTLTGEAARQIPRLQRIAYRLAFGARTGWYGMDVFHFDESDRITAKYSYRNASRPQLRRDLA